MCKVYNPVGPLTTIKFHLHRHDIYDFNSLNEVINFQKNYSVLQQQIITHHERLIEQERNDLELEVSQLEDFILTEKNNIENRIQIETEQINQRLNDLLSSSANNFTQRIIHHLKEWWYYFKIRLKVFSVKFLIAYSIRNLVKEHKKKHHRYQYIIEHFTDAVNESCSVPLKELERKKGVIDEINSSIYGALGEQKVVRELEKLSDEYFLINDFSLSFQKAIYHRKEDEYIQSIQIDHILVAPSGIFLIETKNWSEESLNNPDFYSPVKQIRRNGFAFYKMISGETEYSKLRLGNHLWGNRKIPVRNVVVFTSSKPKDEFQFVKTLTINQLLGYIKYFEPVFSTEETQKIADYLLHLLPSRL